MTTWKTTDGKARRTNLQYTIGEVEITELGKGKTLCALDIELLERAIKRAREAGMVQLILLSDGPKRKGEHAKKNESHITCFFLGELNNDGSVKREGLIIAPATTKLEKTKSPMKEDTPVSGVGRD